MASMMASSTVEKFHAILAKIAYFELNFHSNSQLSKFNELSENNSKFWIISLLDREICLIFANANVAKLAKIGKN